MNKYAIKNHIIDAIATYICIKSIRDFQFINDVNTDHISEILHASFLERERALWRARDMIRDFT